MTRRELREQVFKLIFQREFYEGEELARQEVVYLSETEGLTHIEQEQVLRRSSQVLAHLPEIDALLLKVSTGWKPTRMNKVDLSLLRLAVYEMRFDEAVPEKVAINEAVELAKKFGGDDSPAFINGVLAKLMGE